MLLLMIPQATCSSVCFYWLDDWPCAGRLAVELTWLFKSMQVLGTPSWGDVTKSYWSCLSWFWWGSMSPCAGDCDRLCISKLNSESADVFVNCQDMRLEALCPKRQQCQGPLLQGELWDTWDHGGVANFSLVGILLGPILSQIHHCFRSCLGISLDIGWLLDSRYSRYGCQGFLEFVEGGDGCTSAVI